MIQDFLNFVDVATEYGKVSISGKRLFELFCEKRNLTGNHAYGFRLRLEAKGIL